MDDSLRALMRLYRLKQDDATAHALARAITRGAEGGAVGVVSIPTIGSRLTLAEPWTFTLVGEKRNVAFWLALGLPIPERARKSDWSKSGYYDFAPHYSELPEGSDYNDRYFTVEAKLEVGAVLRVDRIYIKHGGEEFDSVSFVCENAPGTVKKGKNFGRFWAKLYDVNKIVCEWADETIPRDVSESRRR